MYRRQFSPPDETDFREGIRLPTQRYVWGQDMVGQRGVGLHPAHLQSAGGVTQPAEIGLMANMGYTQAFCFLYDANGNVTDTVNAGGGIMGQYRYDGFGNLLGQTRTIGIRQNGVVQGLIDQSIGFSTKWVSSGDRLITCGRFY